VQEVQLVRARVARHLFWVGPATVLAAAGAVLIVQQIALRSLTLLPVSLLEGVEPVFFTVVLVSAAVIVFGFVLHESADPIHTFRRIAFITLIVSLIPDIALGLSSVRWASWPLAFTFIVMHIVAWLVTVAMLTRFVPITLSVEEK
jgi:hypothetical protein